MAMEAVNLFFGRMVSPSKRRHKMHKVHSKQGSSRGFHGFLIQEPLQVKLTTEKLVPLNWLYLYITTKNHIKIMFFSKRPLELMVDSDLPRGNRKKNIFTHLSSDQNP